MPGPVEEKLNVMLKKADSRRAGLCISVFEASPSAEAGVPIRDIYLFSGYAVALVQLGIAAIPWGVWGQWEIFAITAGGTILAFTTGSLPRWKVERWNCRRNSKKTFVLTRGNGSQHAIVVNGGGRGLDLEDLATSGDAAGPLGSTGFATLGLTALWIALLVTVSGIKNYTWFLVAVGALGMIHTTVIAGAPRRPDWFGIPLQFRQVFAEPTVMDALKATEIKYPGLGRAMLLTFFPGGLRQEDDSWWSDARERECEGHLE